MKNNSNFKQSIVDKMTRLNNTTYRTKVTGYMKNIPVVNRK